MLTKDGRQLPSHGPKVCRFIESMVRLGRGDFYGERFRLTSYQRRWFHRLYEYFPETGRRRYKQAWFGTAKGNGKTPFEAGTGAVELAGPTAPRDPLVLVSAASLGQSDLVFGDLKIGTTEASSPLAEFIEPFELSLQLRGMPGEAKRVAAVAGSNDGPRATCLLVDEAHEWLGRLEDVYDVLDGAVGKRRDAFTVGISTAGFDKRSMLGKKYAYGCQVATGEITDDAFLFEWYEIPPEFEVPERIVTEADLEQWERAVLFANPALAEADFLDWSYIRSRFDGAQRLERYKWLRYHGNRWTQVEAQWLPPGDWTERAHPEVKVAERSPIVLAMSGTYTNDSVGIVGCTPAGHAFVVHGEEEKADGAGVDRGALKKALAEAMARYRVVRLVVNPLGWKNEAEEWAELYGARTVAEFEWANWHRRRADACDRFYTAVTDEGSTLTHDGHPMLARHLENAVPREHAEGSYISRAGMDGPHISLAVAAVMAFDSHKAADTRPARLSSI